MSVREVLRYPHPLLKERAAELDLEADLDVIAGVTRDLLDTMESFGHCVGIAAPQIDELVRAIVVDVSGHKKANVSHGRLVLINPVVRWQRGSEIGREGCLSIPDFTANVIRATELELEASDPSGRPVQLRTEGFEARCLLHEIDHLDGILFLDRVRSFKDDVFARKSWKK